ncbi:hypothetical protein HPB49_011211 [Dermacentor silvarum]|uniref:Uncharacterized protein n=1 Tax=Dermacentor silvarum TaxID=543639 RepID=A0ACB8C379_DERSI|nr:hypothetical protein HPB49_011211 [Dermacentor silvarum]
MRVRFTSEDDLNLLNEVFAENPFEQTSRWRTIATNVGDALVPAKTFSVRAVRERLDLLMAYFKAGDEANLKNVEPPPETAEDIFEAIYDDPSELPHCGDESEPGVVQEQPDCADVSGAGTPQSDQTLRNQTSRIQASNRRKRSHASGTNADHEFLEKRWNHERELNAQATQGELEKIALKREELEAKERRSERKSKHQQNKLEKDYTLKEKELELRAHELKAREQQNETLSKNQQALLQTLDAVVN